ncbi:hypothetical protein MANES_10G089900v8 [Manihot esculenta]|uniref:Uncharacterized protein n=1 Tax=Manihot esculenta TaxID=3983 RepID=A0ACB7GZ84_MANES|nr:hypothetical protein MANES_10G089900v8 [Manihot esculenta]
MALWKISAFVVCMVGLALVLPSHAQNSPQDYLDAHNAARSAIVGANIPALLYDTTLEADVQLYLSTLLGQCNINVDLSLNGINVKVKENVLTGLDAVNAWVRVCNHYTQVIWKSSVSVGCFRTQCLDNLNLWIVGCKYSPPGNILGQRPY